MADTALQAPPIEPAAHSSRPDLNKGFNPLTMILFFGILANFLYAASIRVNENAARWYVAASAALLCLATAVYGGRGCSRVG